MALFAFTEWWELLGTAERVFWTIGSAGTTFLVLQTILSFVGMDADMDVDLNVDTNFGLEIGIFSFKSIIAFLTFFGWMGVIGLGRGWSMPMIILASAGAGLLAMSLVAYMLYQFQKLESSGNMRIEDAVFEEGEVYLVIPAATAGTGQVTLKLNGTIMELQAVTKGAKIPTGTKVQVVDIIEKNTLLVEPILELKATTE